VSFSRTGKRGELRSLLSLVGSVYRPRGKLIGKEGGSYRPHGAKKGRNECRGSLKRDGEGSEKGRRKELSEVSNAPKRNSAGKTGGETIFLRAPGGLSAPRANIHSGKSGGVIPIPTSVHVAPGVGL